MVGRRPRVAVVASHPVQYQAPWYRALASVCDLQVFFCHRQDSAGQAAAGFGGEFVWDVPLTGGFASTWLVNVASEPSVERFDGCDTPEVADRIARGQFDSCIVNGWYLKSYVQAIQACRQIGVPVLVRGDSQMVGRRTRAIRVAKYLPYRWFLRRIDGHLYVGSRNQQYLQHYGVPESKLFFAPHAVDNVWFREQLERACHDGRAKALSEELGVPPNSEIVLFAGKLIDKKRPLDFVEAMAQLSDRRPGVQGVIVGSGPLESAVRQRTLELGAPVIMAGFRNQSQMPSCYALARALVLPSDGRETWGLVVNEAMACGVPAAVSADVGSAPDLADGTYSGVSFPCGDIRALAEAVERLLDARRDQPAAVEAALRRKMREFSLERAVEGTLEAVEGVRRRAHARQESRTWR